MVKPCDLCALALLLYGLESKQTIRKDQAKKCFIILLCIQNISSFFVNGEELFFQTTDQQRELLFQSFTDR